VALTVFNNPSALSFFHNPSNNQDAGKSYSRGKNNTAQRSDRRALYQMCKGPLQNRQPRNKDGKRQQKDQKYT
jgi:hypothetical protein